MLKNRTNTMSFCYFTDECYDRRSMADVYSGPTNVTTLEKIRDVES